MQKTIRTWVITMAMGTGLSLAAPIAFAQTAGGPAGGAMPGGAAAMQPMTMNDLPSSVRRTLEKEAKGNPVAEIRKGTDENGRTLYMAEVGSGKKATDLTISPEGKVLSRKAHAGAPMEHEPANP
jgi:hypothetical protein